jgi:hypothetical protein
LGIGNDTEVMISPGFNAVSYRPLKNLSAGCVPLVVVMVAFKPSTAAG